MGIKIKFLFFFSNLEQVKEMKLGGDFLLVKRLFINIFFSLPYCYKGMKLEILKLALFNFLLKLFNGPEYDHLKTCIKKFDLFRNFFISFIFFVKSSFQEKKIKYVIVHRTMLNSIVSNYEKLNFKIKIKLE